MRTCLPDRIEKVLQSSVPGLNEFDLPDHLGPGDRELVNAELVGLMEQERPATPPQIAKTLAVLLSVTKSEKKSGQEWKIIGDQYSADLADIPGDILDAAAQHLRKTATFFPTIAEIRTTAQQFWAPRHIRIFRLKALLRLPTEPREEPSARQKEENLAVLRSYLDSRDAFIQGTEPEEG